MERWVWDLGSRDEVGDDARSDDASYYSRNSERKIQRSSCRTACIDLIRLSSEIKLAPDCFPVPRHDFCPRCLSVAGEFPRESSQSLTFTTSFSIRYCCRTLSLSHICSSPTNLDDTNIQLSRKESCFPNIIIGTNTSTHSSFLACSLSFGGAVCLSTRARSPS